MHYAGTAAVVLIFASIALLLESVGAGLVGMYVGVAVLALANYTSYRVGQSDFFIGPSFAALLALSSIALAIITALGVLGA